MNASTLFGLTAALLLALTTGVVARITGVFDNEQPAPAPSAAVAEVEVAIARKNIYAGIGIGSDRVAMARIRVDDPLYTANESEIIRVPAAILDRVPLRDITAGQMILRKDLAAQELPQVPEPPEGMVAVNVSIPPERAHGGLIRRGQHVDIMLTSEIHSTLDPDDTTIKSAVIARNVEVLTVRNRLMEIIEVSPPNQPIPFTLALGPYRAALLEQAKFKGVLSLHLSQGLTTNEFADDSEKDRLVINGDLAIGDQDFAEIFHLEPIQAPAPPEPPAPPPTPSAPPKPVVTRHFIGTSEHRVDTFSPLNNQVLTDTARDNASNPSPAISQSAPIVASAPRPSSPPRYVFSTPKPDAD